MTNPEPSIPMSLLVHDGELADVRALFGEIGVAFVDRPGGLAPGDEETEWGVVIASPKRMLRLASLHATTRIAVMSQDSRTLRNSLRRDGIEILVRRPVHPATLRALVVHALYRGPEKRRTRRVSVGAPVSYRAGWRQRPAVLVDLSLGGCRLLTERQLEPGAPLSVHLPAEIAQTKALRVKGSVLQSESDEQDGRFVTTVRFASASRRVVERLKTAVVAHTGGPALFEGAPSPLAEATDAPEPKRETPPEAERPPPHAVERRETPRHRLDRRVISLSEEATRVLMGRDITLGGMRVNRHPTLDVGTDLSLAIHVPGRETPLVVRAKVHRDDGERGMVLRFHELPPEASRYLNHVMDHLPLVEDHENGDGCLVTEILEAC